MKIEIIPAHTPAYSRRNKLKTETENAVDLDPDKSRSGAEHKDHQQASREHNAHSEDLSSTANMIPKDNSRIHVVA